MITYFRPTNYHSLLAINKEELLAIERDLDNKYKNAADRNRGKKRKERQRDVVDSVNHKEGDEIEDEATTAYSLLLVINLVILNVMSFPMEQSD